MGERFTCLCPVRQNISTESEYPIQYIGLSSAEFKPKKKKKKKKKLSMKFCTAIRIGTNIKINYQSLEVVDSSKYLVVNVIEDITWRKHR